MTAAPQWLQTPGPHSSAAASVAIMEGDTIFMGRSNGALWRSYDGGITWKTLPTFSDYVVTLAAYPGGRVLAGQRSGTVHISNDYGKTWNLALDKLGEVDLSLFQRGSERVVYAASLNSGLLRSRNGGVDWVEVFENDAVSLAIAADGVLYMGTSSGAYVSDDQGDTWRFIGLSDYKINALITTDDGVVHAATDFGVFSGGGPNADWVNIGPGVRAIGNLLAAADGGMLAAPADGGLYRNCGPGCWTKTDLPNVVVNDLVLHPDGTVIAATAVGLFDSRDDGMSWTANLATVASSYVPEMIVTRNGRIMAASHSLGIMYTDDPRSLWNPVPGMENVVVASLFQSAGGAVLAGTWDQKIYRSTNDGMNWQTNDEQLLQSVVLEFVDGPGGEIYAASDNGVLASYDDGASWGFTEPLPVFKPAQGITFSPSTDWIVVATDSGVFRSVQLGRSWFAASNGLIDLDVTHVRLDPRDGRMVCATADGRIYRYNLSAGEWIPLGREQPGRRTYDLFVCEELGILSAGPDGVQLLRHESTAWEPYDDGLQGNAVRVLAMDRFGVLFAGTDQKGVFYMDPRVVASADEPGNVGADAIAPQPVQDRLSVRVGDLAAGDCELQIFDVRGVRRLTFRRSVHHAGDHTFGLDVGVLTAGTYLLQLVESAGGRHSFAFVKH